MTDTQPPSKLFRNLVILIVVTSLPVLAVDPVISRFTNNFLSQMLVGCAYAAYFAHTTMIASFFVYGTKPIQQRISPSIAWLLYIALLLAIFIIIVGDFEVITIATVILFLVVQVAVQSLLVYSIRMLFGIRVRHLVQHTDEPPNQADKQFAIKHILLTMTFMAALLAFGRLVVGEVNIGPDFFTQIAALIWLTLTAQLMATILIAAFLLHRFATVAVVGGIALTIIAGLVEAAALARLPPISKSLLQFVMTINLVTAFICGLFAFEIRRQGYRIVITKH